MKSNFQDLTMVFPLIEDEAINRRAFPSAIVGGRVIETEDNATLTLLITHSDDIAGEYTDVEDKYLLQHEKVALEKVGDYVYLNVDLVGCKQFIKIKLKYQKPDGTVATAKCSLAFAIGDAPYSLNMRQTM